MKFSNTIYSRIEIELYFFPLSWDTFISYKNIEISCLNQKPKKGNVTQSRRFFHKYISHCSENRVHYTEHGHIC